MTTATSFAQKEHDGWYAAVGAGINGTYEGRFSKSESFGYTYPAVTATVGKWLNRSFAVGLAYDGLKLQNDKYFHDGVDFHYAQVNVLWNIFNCLGGYKENRVFSLIPYVHAGAAINDEIAYCGGLGLSLPICFGKLSLVPDIKASVVSDKVYSDVYDGMFAAAQATLKLQYNF